jgi:hypothetical protein
VSVLVEDGAPGVTIGVGRAVSPYAQETNVTIASRISKIRRALRMDDFLLGYIIDQSISE